MSTTAPVVPVGPVVGHASSVISQNSTTKMPGLFSVTSFIRPGERDLFDEFESGYLAELAPDSPLEYTLAGEIIHAAWRLQRCADLETNPPENLTDEDFDRLQTSIDRARAAAQRTFHRSLKELRRLQAERVFANLTHKQVPETAPQNLAKQTQSQPESPALTARSAPCPWKSGQKYNRSRTGQPLSPEPVRSR